MDEIEQRLREATDACIKNYEGWRKDQKEGDARESLMEAVHELRKVAARLEIEIAVSERNEMAARPIPIPPHRASRKGGGDFNDYGDDIGNVIDQGGQQPQQNHGGGHDMSRNLRRRRHHHGGGGGGGGHGGGHGGGQG